MINAAGFASIAAFEDSADPARITIPASVHGVRLQLGEKCRLPANLGERARFLLHRRYQP